MAKKQSVININELLGIEENIKKDEIDNKSITELKIIDLVPFKNHPFKLYEGDRLDDMVESIKEYGIILPLIVRPIEDNKYEILSGHNRANAGRIAGLEKVPVVIKENLTDEEAMLIVTETNLIQRSFSELSHSEKARILTERHNVIKNQGKRMDIINEIEMMSNIDDLEENSTSYQFDKKLKSNEKLGEKYDLSPATISRYLRIDTLINELKERLDNNEIPFTSAVDLSFLKKDEQETVEDILITHGFKINLKKSYALKNLSQKRNFKYNNAYEILSGKFFDKPKKSKNFKFTSKFKKNISKYFKKNQTQTEIEKVIEEALETYFSQNREIDSQLEEEKEV